MRLKEVKNVQHLEMSKISDKEKAISSNSGVLTDRLILVNGEISAVKDKDIKKDSRVCIMFSFFNIRLLIHTLIHIQKKNISLLKIY